MLPHGMGDIECDACAEKDSQIASLKELVREWMPKDSGAGMSLPMWKIDLYKRSKEALK